MDGQQSRLAQATVVQSPAAHRHCRLTQTLSAPGRSQQQAGQLDHAMERSQPYIPMCTRLLHKLQVGGSPMQDSRAGSQAKRAHRQHVLQNAASSRQCSQQQAMQLNPAACSWQLPARLRQTAGSAALTIWCRPTGSCTPGGYVQLEETGLPDDLLTPTRTW